MTGTEAIRGPGNVGNDFVSAITALALTWAMFSFIAQLNFILPPPEPEHIAVDFIALPAPLPVEKPAEAVPPMPAPPKPVTPPPSEPTFIEPELVMEKIPLTELERAKPLALEPEQTVKLEKPPPPAVVTPPAAKPAVAAPPAPPVLRSTPPVFTYKEEPVYPILARKRGKTGTVVIEVTVEPDGTIAKAEVVKKAGYGFDKAAMAAMMKSKLKPGTVKSKPVRSTARIEYNFILE